jgi:hypothetical protein
MKRQSKPTIVFADFSIPASIKTEPNPPEYDIDTAYDRLKDATVIELSWLIPRWGLRHCDRAGCDCESLVLRSADHPMR